MTKQKEKAPDGDNARVRFALYHDVDSYQNLLNIMNTLQ